MFNSVNKNHVVLSVGAVAADKEVGLIYAHKKMIVRNLSLVDIALVALDAVNYVESSTLVDGAAVGNTVSTAAGLAAREALTPVMPSDGITKRLGITLEKGEFLSVNLDVNGTGAYTNLSIHADVEIVGNNDQ